MAEKIKFYIATSDNSSYILKPFAWLFDKYCPKWDIEILGYSVFPELPERYKCVSLAQKQESLNTWTSYLYNYFRNVTDEFVIFGLDDFLITQPIDYEIFNLVIEVMKQNKHITRYELGIGHQFHEYKIEYHYNGMDFYAYSQSAKYRISTQFSLWRTDYLLKHLNHRRTPFEFEAEGSKDATLDYKMIIGTDNRFALNHVWSGAISSRHPGQINIEGIKREDIEEMISLGLLDRSKLQYGMRIENNPKYE